MRILFIADGRSPTAINWIRHFTERGDEVILISSSYAKPDLALKALHIVPLGLASAERAASPNSVLRAPGLVGLRTKVKQWLGPLMVKRKSAQVRRIIEDVKPDLVHAMRIPFEGMVAADGYRGIPLVISIWGNDFTLHAASNQYMRHYTQWALRVAHGLHADCQRDITLATQLGFDSRKPSLVVPGSGGIRPEIFFPEEKPEQNPIVINPRGFRAYVQNETFFKAIPLVLRQIPSAKFICTGMIGLQQVENWIRGLGIGDSVTLLDNQPQNDLANLFRKSMVVVSLTTHDGTPNSLIEAMACGCYPVAGDIESIREWIMDGQNGTLVNPLDPQTIADGIVQAIQDRKAREKAFEYNRSILAERAYYENGMRKVEAFYSEITSNTI